MIAVILRRVQRLGLWQLILDKEASDRSSKGLPVSSIGAAVCLACERC